jgi:hypothetical protein
MDLTTILLRKSGTSSFADGHEFVGVGIKPDIRAHLTRADIIAGRDFVLETAVHSLQNKTLTSVPISVNCVSPIAQRTKHRLGQHWKNRSLAPALAWCWKIEA